MAFLVDGTRLAREGQGRRMTPGEAHSGSGGSAFPPPSPHHPPRQWPCQGVARPGCSLPDLPSQRPSSPLRGKTASLVGEPLACAEGLRVRFPSATVATWPWVGHRTPGLSTSVCSTGPKLHAMILLMPGSFALYPLQIECSSISDYSEDH